MDIKKLQLFADVAETKNFTRTGDRMGYTQSGVSHMLKSLENELGFSLFIRSKQGVKLTEAAEILLPDVRSLLATSRQIEQTIGEINGIATGQLTIATFSSISIHWLPRIIHRFQELYPAIGIRLMEGGSYDIAGWVESDQADFGFLSSRQIRGLDWLPLYEDPLMAVLPKDYPAPESGVIPISKFEKEEFIISEVGTDYDIHHALDVSGVSPNISFSSTDDFAIVSMVANRLGLSILPKLHLRGTDNIVSAYPLDPPFSRTLGIAVKSKDSLSPAARRFIKLTEELLPGLIED
jgi:DNA-binding transcriptional LysR family regulator